jgi:hypothetical protein
VRLFAPPHSPGRSIPASAAILQFAPDSRAIVNPPLRNACLGAALPPVVNPHLSAGEFLRIVLAARAGELREVR